MIKAILLDDLRDLPAGYKPYEVAEGDGLVDKITPKGAVVYKRRVRRLQAVSGDRLVTYIQDMGPPTGEDELLIPCGEEVEMAHIHDILDAAVEKRRVRAIRRALEAPVKTAEWQDAVRRYGEEMVAQKAGRSTIGPYQRVQRVS